MKKVTGVSGHPIGTDLRSAVIHLVNKQDDYEMEVQEAKGRLLAAKERKQENGERMMDLFIDAGLFHLLKIDQTALRRYLMDMGEYGNFPR